MANPTQPTQPRSIDNTSMALGEMREFMTHHRRQMDQVTERLEEHSNSLHHLRVAQDNSMKFHDQTRQDVGDIKESLSVLVEHHQKRKVSRKSIVKGFGAGVIVTAIFATVYYRDSTFLQVVYRYTIGLVL